MADRLAARYVCPACHGRPKTPSTRAEGGSSSCRHCNRTLTFNFMRDPGDPCTCLRAREEACPTCLGEGWVDVPRRDTVPITLWGRLRPDPPAETDDHTQDPRTTVAPSEVLHAMVNQILDLGDHPCQGASPWDDDYGHLLADANDLLWAMWPDEWHQRHPGLDPTEHVSDAMRLLWPHPTP